MEELKKLSQQTQVTFTYLGVKVKVIWVGDFYEIELCGICKSANTIEEVENVITDVYYVTSDLRKTLSKAQRLIFGTESEYGLLNIYDSYHGSWVTPRAQELKNALLHY